MKNLKEVARRAREARRDYIKELGKRLYGESWSQGDWKYYGDGHSPVRTLAELDYSSLWWVWSGFRTETDRDSITLYLHGPKNLSWSAATIADYLLRDEKSKTALRGLQYVVSELVANAIEWGNRNNFERTVVVRGRYQDNVLEVSIEDEGKGFDPAKVPDPRPHGRKEWGRIRRAMRKRFGGFGILIIKAYVDSLEYNKKGNIATVRKQIASSAHE